MTQNDKDHLISPSTLLTILVAAKHYGDRPLACAARRVLETDHGIRVSFVRKPSQPAGAKQ